MHKFDPTDHSAHLAELLAQLYRLEDLVSTGDREALLNLVAEMDWRSVADEFELVVQSHYYALERYAHRASYNLQRPYLLLQDCAALAKHMQMIEDALAESPSLHDDADAAVRRAWAREIEKAEGRRQPLREMAPVTGLDELRAAAAEKIELARRLHGKHAAFDAGERVAYGDPGQTIGG